MSIVICGHVDSGKSTTTGRLLFELGGIPEREMEKLKAEAERLGKSSFAFAFYMDRQKEERERGVTISCTTKEFFTDRWHYTVIDAQRVEWAGGAEHGSVTRRRRRGLLSTRRSAAPRAGSGSSVRRGPATLGSRGWTTAERRRACSVA